MSTAADRKHLDTMHQAHGRLEAQTCGACAHCISNRRYEGARGTVAYRVCRKAAPHVNGHARATFRVWRTSWTACGLFVPEA